MNNILNSINNIISIIMAATFKNNNIQYNEVNESQLQSLLAGEYSSAWNAFKNGSRIYRGVRNNPIYDYYTMTSGIRTSQNLTNMYTILMSEILPSWREYPKRNRSFI